METNCKYCGKPLTESQIKKGNKYCSRRCSGLYTASQKMAPVPEVRCKNCGKLLTRTQIKRENTFCSTACAALTVKERNRENEQRLYKKKCAACGKEFTSVGYRQRYCSEECREYGRELSRARAREQYQKQKAAEEVKKRNKNRLANDLAQAKANGMSYGRWKAMQYMQSLPKIQI